MVGLLDIYSGVYIDVFIVSMMCSDLYRWSIQVCKWLGYLTFTVECTYMSP